MSAIEREKVGEKQEKERREKEEKKKRKGMLISSRYTRGGKIFLSRVSLSCFIPTSLHRRESLSLSLFFYQPRRERGHAGWNPVVWFDLPSLSLSLSFIHIFCFSLFQGPHIELWQGTHIYTHTYAPIVPPRRNPFKTTDAAHETVYETISLSLASPFSPDSMDWTDRSIYTQSIPRRVFLSFLFFFRGKITDRWTRDLEEE